MRITPRHTQVILDGEDQVYCVAANAEEGWVDVIVPDMIDNLTTERRYGTVTIVPLHDFPVTETLPLANEMDASEG